MNIKRNVSINKRLSCNKSPHQSALRTPLHNLLTKAMLHEDSPINRASFPLSKPPFQGDRGELNLLFSGNVESVGGVCSCAPAPQLINLKEVSDTHVFTH